MRASTDDPSALCQQGYRGAAQRSAPERSWRSAEKSSEQESRGEEKNSWWKDGLSPLQQAGLYSAASGRFNMPLGSKRLAGITALVASLLLGSCGTGGKGERLCALSGEQSGLSRAMFLVEGEPQGLLLH